MSGEPAPPASPGQPGRLILFTRWPAPGQAKTRLIPALGPVGAAELHAALAQHALAWCLAFIRQHPARLELRCVGAPPAAFRRWLGYAPLIRPQAEGDLGARMHQALGEALAEGAGRAVLIGSDCPGLTDAVLAQAFAALTDHDLVLGPATDGGYYLVGLTRPAPEIFRGIAWGTEQVLEQTLAAAPRAGLRHALLPALTDLDRPADLGLLDAAPTPPAPTRPAAGVSVVIPALNEAANLARAVASAAVAGVEVIVVDGGSTDGTYDVARELGATAVQSFPGRGRQLNLGAALASGDSLVFLHGDSRLPAGWPAEVRRVLGLAQASLGCFRFRLDHGGWQARLVERMVYLRTTLGQLPYGDQALFLRAGVLRALGGYAEIPMLEDYDLVVRARRLGRVVQARLAAPTSGRRWRRLGLVRTTFINQVMITGYALGVPAERLARFYGAHRR